MASLLLRGKTVRGIPSNLGLKGLSIWLAKYLYSLFDTCFFLLLTFVKMLWFSDIFLHLIRILHQLRLWCMLQFNLSVVVGFNFKVLHSCGVMRHIKSNVKYISTLPRKSSKLSCLEGFKWPFTDQSLLKYSLQSHVRI